MKAFKLKSTGLLVLIFLALSQNSCKQVYHLANISEDRYEIDSRFSGEEDIQEIIRPYKIKLDSIMNDTIAYTPTEMVKDKPESTLGNWMTDIIYMEAKERYEKPLDFAIQNYGGIRLPRVSEGFITVRTIYELMPFDNEMVVLETRGIVVKALFEKIANMNGWPVSSNIKLKIGPDKNIVSLKINGEEFDPIKTYRFALPDYIANGGDGCDFLINQDQTKLDIKIRDAIIEHLRNKPMEILEAPKKDKRIIRM